MGSIGAPPEDDDLVSAVLNGLNDDKWKAFATSVYVREIFLDFEDLSSLMITEEMRMQGPDSGKGFGEQAQAFYSTARRVRRRNSRGRSGGRFGNYHQNHYMQKMHAVVVEEEIRDHGGALEAEVDIKTEITTIQMVAGFVEK